MPTPTPHQHTEAREFSSVFSVERSYLADTIYGKIMRCRVKATGETVAVKVYERDRAVAHRTRSGFRVLVRCVCVCVCRRNPSHAD